MTAVPAQPDLKPLKKKHWLRRIILTLFVLLAVAALTVQIVLWTDLPRGIVIGQIEKQLGLSLTVKSLSTGWLGNTELSDVTISLPLADKAFLEVPAMKVKNTSLFGLMLGRSVEVEAIELNQPHLHVRQGADGTWNLQELAQLLARAGGSSTGQASAASSSPAVMPNIHIVGAIISITDNSNRTAEIEPLSVEGYRDTAVSWKYDVRIPSHVSITGRLVPGGNSAHEVTLKVQDVSSWARPWDARVPQLTIDANWRGALSESGIDGRLEVKSATLGAPGAANVSGAVSIGVAGGLVTAQPDNLLLNLTGSPVSQLKLASGSITYNPASKDVKVTQLLVALFGGDARVSADYNVNANAGQMTAAWENLVLPGDITHSGTFSANLSQPFPDQIKVDAHLDTTGSRASGTLTAGAWTAAVAFGMTGKSFTDLNWSASVEKLLWRRHDQQVKLDGLTLTGGLHDNALALRSIGLPNRDLITGTASYHLTGAKPWEVHLRGQRWPFYPVQGTELAFDLAMHGDDTAVYLEKSVFKTPDAELTATASYKMKAPTLPLNIEFWINNASSRNIPVAVATYNQAKLVNGTVEGHFKMGGTLEPLQLQASGNLDGHEIDVRGYHIGELHFELSRQSRVDDKGVYFYTDQLSLFGGQWGIDGEYVFASDEVKVNVDLSDVSLSHLAAAAGQTDLSGSARGRISMIHPWFAPDLNHLTISPSTIVLSNVNANDFAIDQITATVSLENGTLKINPVLTRGNGAADLKISTTVNDIRHINLAAAIRDWPIDMPGAAAHMDVSATVPSAVIRLPNAQSPDAASRELRVNTPLVAIHSTTMVNRDKLGEWTAYLGVNGRTLDLRGIHLVTLGGRLDGQAYVDLDHLTGATAEFTWERLNLQRMALVFPQVKEFSGEMAGDLRIAPATVPHPREPLAMVATVQFTNGAWRTLPIKDARVSAYFGQGLDPEEGGWRVVLDDSTADRSFIHLADGAVELWGRFGDHRRGSSSQAQLTFHDIDLNKVVHALDPSAAQMPGKVAGSILLLRAPSPTPPSLPVGLDQMFPGRVVSPVSPVTDASSKGPTLKKLLDPIYGEGKVDLSQTNLADFGPFAALYNTAHLFQDVHKPIGTGSVEFHLERGSLTIEHMRYFNRGTEVLAVARIDQIWRVPDSPLSATVALTVRPLANAKIFFISDIDVALTSLQQSLGLTAVRVKGTLHKYRTPQLGLSELGDEMRKFIVGDATGK